MKPHRTDGVSLSFGLIFLTIVVWWGVSQVVPLRLPALGWLAACGLILFGVLGLLGAIRSGRRTEVPQQPIAAEVVPADHGVPADLHADIIRELMQDSVDRLTTGHAPADGLPSGPHGPDGERAGRGPSGQRD